MSAPVKSDNLQPSGSSNRAKKTKKKKKPASGKSQPSSNGLDKAVDDADEMGAHENDSRPPSPTKESPSHLPLSQSNGTTIHLSNPPNILSDKLERSEDTTADMSEKFEALARERDTLSKEVSELRKSLEEIRTKHEKDLSAAQKEIDDARDREKSIDSQQSKELDAGMKEREALRNEIEGLRRSMEGSRKKHEEDLNEARSILSQGGRAESEKLAALEKERESLRQEVEKALAGKEKAEEQYRDLIERVNTLQAQLKERLKNYADQINETRAQNEELEEQNRELQESNSSLEEKLSTVKKEHNVQANEIETLRSRSTLSQQNWIKERDDMNIRQAQLKEELELAKEGMQHWEVLAMDERALRTNLEEKVAEVEEQLFSLKEMHEKAVSQRDSHAQMIEGLQRTLRDIQETRKQELRELVEKSQTEMDEVNRKLDAAEEAASRAKHELESTKIELDRALPFEKEVKEKQLHIGKLRHEAVILNEHLTKALRYIKQRTSEDMVDRQVVTNHFLHFITLDRADPRKFQVLQIIAALLSWTDEQKEQAGLARPGATASSGTTSLGLNTSAGGTPSSSLRLPLSPFRRTPSAASLGAEASAHAPGRDRAGSKETLAELWSEFLEREALEGAAGHGGGGSGGGEGSRRGSTATSGTGTG